MSGIVGAVLVAAGASRRMGFDKLWSPLGTGLVLEEALGVLAGSPSIDRLVLVVAEAREQQARRLVAGLRERVEVRTGGVERRDSVASGVEALAACKWILVHDAARPFLTEAMIVRGLEAARATGAAVAAVPVKDTVKRVVNGAVVETLPREELWLVQTPQVFRVDVIRAALQLPDRDVTDEATLVERLGGEVRVFPGGDENWKVTTPEDLELARTLVARRTGLSVISSSLSHA